MTRYLNRRPRSVHRRRRTPMSPMRRRVYLRTAIPATAHRLGNLRRLNAPPTIVGYEVRRLRDNIARYDETARILGLPRWSPRFIGV